MQIIIENPPNILKIKQVFDIEDKKMVFCWGDVLYNPSGLNIADHIKIHELVHSRQQVIPQAWWDKYLIDSEFRLSQELEAYRAQYQFSKKFIKDRNVLARFLWVIASDLANLYNVNISRQEAMKQIKQ